MPNGENRDDFVPVPDPAGIIEVVTDGALRDPMRAELEAATAPADEAIEEVAQERGWRPTGSTPEQHPGSSVS